MTPEASDPSMAGTSLIDYITTHFKCFVKARPLLHCNADLGSCKLTTCLVKGPAFETLTRVLQALRIFLNLCIPMFPGAQCTGPIF